MASPFVGLQRMCRPTAGILGRVLVTFRSAGAESLGNHFCNSPDLSTATSRSAAMKRADHGTGIKGSEPAGKGPAATQQTGKKPGDAREDPAQLKQNQADLAVNEDHKTDEMED